MNSSFFNFDKMLTPSIIKIVFIIVSVLTILLGFGFIVSGINSMYGGGSLVFLGLALIVVGPLFTRIYCETLIVVFKMHEALHKMAEIKSQE
ncbi:DUF4282 domain-containing protein [Priestia flexa]|uniref:DUF4282 domain-containing protein n=1 Tax=Priestia flexa TaxID=86664 RepID=UPI001CD36C15|nr:DUF4282 domain-containing protein [Priestia flexa]MCA1201454.1 DUF4282 domain-containing protein [Priestia flexa]